MDRKIYLTAVFTVIALAACNVVKNDSNIPKKMSSDIENEKLMASIEVKDISHDLQKLDNDYPCEVEVDTFWQEQNRTKKSLTQFSYSPDYEKKLFRLEFTNNYTQTICLGQYSWPNKAGMWLGAEGGLSLQTDQGTFSLEGTHNNCVRKNRIEIQPKETLYGTLKYSEFSSAMLNDKHGDIELSFNMHPKVCK